MKLLRVFISSFIVLAACNLVLFAEDKPSSKAVSSPGVNPAELPGMGKTVAEEKTAPAAEEAAAEAAPEAAAGTAEAPAESRELSGNVYEVKKGDTLWDIAGSFYSNPYDWKTIWDGNKSDIANPNLIYPNQKVLIPGKSREEIEQAAAESAAEPAAQEAASESAASAPEPAAAPEPQARAEEPAEAAPEASPAEEAPRPKVTIRAPKVPETLVVDRDWTADGRVIGDIAKKILISQNDLVYINVGAADGAQKRMRGDLYRKGQKVRNPDTGKSLGYVAKRIGVIELQDVQDETSVAVILTSYEPVKIGDIVKFRN